MMGFSDEESPSNSREVGGKLKLNQFKESLQLVKVHDSGNNSNTSFNNADTVVQMNTTERQKEF